MPNRYLCTVLDEMRTCCETRNFSYLMGLIEEAQTLGNRMEAALFDQDDLRAAKKQHDKLRASLEALEKEIEEAKDRLSKLNEEILVLRRKKHALLKALRNKDVLALSAE